jgi:hypothetical protein
MKKGVILEVRPKYLIMMTSEGEFLKGKKRKPEYIVGQEIIFNPYYSEWKRRLYVLSRKKVIVTTAAVILITGLLLVPFVKENKAYAYVTVDSKPSIELALNKNLDVLNATSFNEEGKNVLKKADLKKYQSFTKAAESIIEKSRSLGYLKNNQEIIISSVITNANPQQLSKKINSLYPVVKKYKDRISIEKGSSEDRKTALKKGMTTGNYLWKRKYKDKAERQSSSSVKENTSFIQKSSPIKEHSIEIPAPYKAGGYMEMTSRSRRKKVEPNHINKRIKANSIRTKNPSHPSAEHSITRKEKKIVHPQKHFIKHYSIHRVQENRKKYNERENHKIVPFKHKKAPGYTKEHPYIHKLSDRKYKHS